jgi:hypothetical protein
MAVGFGLIGLAIYFLNYGMVVMKNLQDRLKDVRIYN